MGPYEQLCPLKRHAWRLLGGLCISDAQGAGVVAPGLLSALLPNDRDNVLTVRRGAQSRMRLL